MTVTIEEEEKVGIVGRSGCGKSTLLKGITRILEPMKGKILLGGNDITKMGLKDLRSQITVIP